MRPSASTATIGYGHDALASQGDKWLRSNKVLNLHTPGAGFTDGIRRTSAKRS